MRVDPGDDGLRTDLVPVAEHHAGRPAALDPHALDGRLGDDLGPVGECRLRARPAHPAGAALGEAPGTKRAVDLAHVVVQQHVGGARRSHAEECPDDPADGHRRLEDVALEPLIEKVDRAHREQLEVEVAGVLVELAVRPAQAQQPQQLLGVERRGIGGGVIDDGLGETGELAERDAELGVDLGVLGGELRDLPSRPRRIAPARQRAPVGQRQERAVERNDLEAVPRQVELADDVRAEQRDDVRANRVREPLEDLLADRGAAEDVALLEHEHLASRLGQVGRADQPVVAAPDDHRVVRRRGRLADVGLYVHFARFRSGL